MNLLSFPLLAVLLISAAVLRAQTPAPAMRTWTSADGRKMEAAFIALEGDAVKVRMANGSTVDVPLTRLSAEDQAFAKSQTAAPAPAATAPGEVAASKTWPRSFSLPDKPEVVVVKEDAEKNEYIYRSPHYEFQCDSKLGSNVVREFGRIFESTWMLNCLLPLDLKPQPEKLREIFLARLFTNKSDYMEAGGIEGSAGVYMSGKKALMVPLQSLGVKMVGSRVSLENNSDDDMATLIHEITHQMMNHWLGRLPTWYIEGSAEYVELLEYKRNGGFSLIGLNRQLQGYAKRMNYSGGGKSFTMIDLEELMTIDGRRWAAALGKDGAATENYGSAGLLTYYFYHFDGNGDAANIIACLRELENVKTNEE
ncbi:MAG: SHD1 domain-containing protein, partial [Prosthecobacter sp.]|nr:SHD1 domain-containing protein [Prosthecobacter sp.]